MNEWIKVALEASMDAGQAIMEVYGREDVGVEYKGDSSPLTLADKAAHEVILEHLSATGIPVLSEEGKHMPFQERQDWDELWIVDPVDGTKEFIKRNGEFTVNIALVRQGRVAGGVVLAPVLGHAYVGVVGEGAGDWTWEAKEAPRRRTPGPRDVLALAFRHASLHCGGQPLAHVPETEAYVDQAREETR